MTSTNTNGRPPKEIEAPEEPLGQIEEQVRALHARALAAIGVAPEVPIPRFRDGARTDATRRWTLVALCLLALPLFFLPTAFFMFDPAIAATLGIDPLGLEFPGLLNSLVLPVLALGVASSALFAAYLGSRHRWRGQMLVIGQAVGAAGLWCAAFASDETLLLVAALGAGIALGSVFTASASLLFDAYPPGTRVRAIARWTSAIVLGNVLGAAIVALSIDAFDLTWRGALMLIAGVATLVVPAGIVPSDPGVGAHDLERIDELVRNEVGARGEHTAELSEAETAVGFVEELRQAMLPRSVLAMSAVFVLIGIVALALRAFVQQFVIARYAWIEADRAWLFVVLAAAPIVPLIVVAVRGDRWFRRNPSRLLRGAAALAAASAAALIVVAFVADPVVTVVGLSATTMCTGVLLAFAVVVVQFGVDPHLRPHALAASVSFLAGALVLGGVLAGQFADRYGVTAALVALAVSFVGAAGAFGVVARSLLDDVSTMVDVEAEREELRVRVSSGQHLPLLSCRHVDFAYGKLQVLFGVEFSVDDGEMVALLGTNGAGKSTLLKVISGLGTPSRGSVHFRGADVTFVDPARRVDYGIAQMPGGRSVFGDMTVVENLKLYGFTLRRSRTAISRGIDATFDAFPVLAERRNQAAATLSGGEQQMLSLGKAFILQPRLLLIDELSLGLAPLVVGRLIDMVRRINETGTAVVVVEQSVNIALSLVDHAYFMERGQVRFDGAAADLLERRDLLRSVFLEGASRGLEAMARQARAEDR
jgi:ABC-type branched-subunit amino acid transport system ATPase component/MFS family permease